jgi:hypothetical protein
VGTELHSGKPNGISPPRRALPVAAANAIGETERREVIMAAKRPDFPA